MATATATISRAELAAERFVLWDVSWAGYQALLKIG